MPLSPNPWQQNIGAPLSYAGWVLAEFPKFCALTGDQLRSHDVETVAGGLFVF